jgi:hypothetical protein
MLYKGGLKSQMIVCNKSLIILRSLIALTIVLLISGCTVPFFGGFGENNLSREEFAQRVEHVFRLQNQMTSEVMMLQESEQPQKYGALLQAEQNMQQMCADLNELVSRDNDGLSTGLFLQLRVEKSVTNCEQAALAVKQLLKP